MASAAKPSTFALQSSLPKLPIPELKDTLSRYERCVSVLQTPEEHAVTKEKIDAFLRTDGPPLQAKLIEYARDKQSYIEDFWYEAYFQNKASVVLNVNPFFVLEDDPTPSRNNQVSRAASLIWSSLKVHDVKSVVVVMTIIIMRNVEYVDHLLSTGPCMVRFE
jgi:carnitine O-acetyltransferase